MKSITKRSWSELVIGVSVFIIGFVIGNLLLTEYDPELKSKILLFGFSATVAIIVFIVPLIAVSAIIGYGFGIGFKAARRK